jgi:AAA domain
MTNEAVIEFAGFETTADGAYVLLVKNGPRIEVSHVHQDRIGRLFARVKIFADHTGCDLVDGADIGLMSLRDRETFASHCALHNGHAAPYWANILLKTADEIERYWQQHGPPESSSAQKTLKVTQLSTVKPERVEFLWKPYLPKGRPTALEGDPGVGKSSLVTKIIAHITTGKAFPNVMEGTPALRDFAPQNVCLLTSEDDPADTLLPRIAVNGGDPARVFLIEGWEQPDGERGIVTMQDLILLRTALEQYQPALLVFDPLQSFFGRGGDMNQANDTRPVLDALTALCKQYGCTPLYVRHIGKTRREKALHAGLGSIDITANMRSVLFLGEDPEHPQRRILAQSKVNNAPRGQSLAYVVQTVVQDLLSPTGDFFTIEAPRLLWDGTSPLTADDLSSPPLVEGEDKSALDQARAFLMELLQDGPVLYDTVQKAAKQAGMTTATLRRAKPLLGVKSRKRRADDTPSKEWPWEWYLPENTQGDPGDSLSRYIPAEHLEHLENSTRKAVSYEEKSRCADEHLDFPAQPQEKQQVILDAQGAHPNDTPTHARSEPLDAPLRYARDEPPMPPQDALQPGGPCPACGWVGLRLVVMGLLGCPRCQRDFAVRKPDDPEKGVAV